MFRWAGRVAVVTGTSAGIGKAIAVDLVNKGVKVVGIARRVERVEELANSLGSAPGKLYPLKCDVSNEEEVIEAFKWVVSKLGTVDILINNAGVAAYNNLLDGPTDSWRKVINTNLLGLSYCTKEAVNIMKQKGVDDGHIIHVNSVLGHGTPFNYYMYAASKHAVTALTEGLRRELNNAKTKIRITSISPGAVKTEIAEASGAPAELIAEIAAGMPMLQPEDVSDAVMYILGTPPHVQVHEFTIKPIGESV